MSNRTTAHRSISGEVQPKMRRHPEVPPGPLSSSSGSSAENHSAPDLPKTLSLPAFKARGFFTCSKGSLPLNRHLPFLSNVHKFVRLLFLTCFAQCLKRKLFRGYLHRHSRWFPNPKMRCHRKCRQVCSHLLPDQTPSQSPKPMPGDRIIPR